MTNIPKDGLNSGVRITFTAGFVVLLLLMIAFLNLPSPSATRSVPYITIIKIPRIDVFSRPSTIDSLWTGRLKINQRADVLARSPDGEWFKIKYGNGSGWVPSVFAKPSIAPIMLPIDVGSPMPTLIIITALPTSVPISPQMIHTAVPVTLSLRTFPNLVLGDVTFNPSLPLTCHKPSSLSIEITNYGSEMTKTKGKVIIRDITIRNQNEDYLSISTFGSLQTGQTITISDIPLTVDSFGGEEHTLVITVKFDASLPEDTDIDNTRKFTYVLQGDC